MCIIASTLICVGVFATAEQMIQDKANVQLTLEDIAQLSTEEIAHLDIDTADEETKEAILSARNEIIYSREWVADGYSMEVVDSEGNVKRTIPKFSELFPGWDLPKAIKNSNTAPPLIIGRDLEKNKKEWRKESVRPEFLNDYTHTSNGIECRSNYFKLFSN